MQPDINDLRHRKTTAPAKRVALKRVADNRVRELEAALTDKTRQLERMETIVRELRADCEKLTKSNRLKDEIVCIATHELKTPLTSVKGYAALARMVAERNASCSACRHHISVVETQTQKVINLANRLLDSSRMQVGRFTLNRAPMDLVEVARAAVEQSRVMSTKHRIELDAAVTQLMGEWDQQRIEEVLNNLLDNAIKYSPTGGLVRASVRVEPGAAHVSISDQGIGVPAEELERLFQLYTRGSNVQKSGIAGLGIGLYVSNEIVLQHGGRLWLESETGKGTISHFQLPL